MKRFLESPADLSPADIIIVGGGITGAAVAYEASLRGYNTILLEKKDFGWATSAATSKLIHGGLRYLNNFEFGLVRESLRERRILENIAPNLVWPLPFIIPNYKHDKTGKWLIRLGMILYDIFSFDKKFTWDKSHSIPRHRWLSTDDIIRMEPSVRSENMTGGSLFYDCQSLFPERLTLAFVRSAIKKGVRAANYATVTGFLRDAKGNIKGVKVRDDLSGQEHSISSRLTINCGGPWADIILGLASGNCDSHQIRRSEGIHIITRKMVHDHAVIIMTPEGRHLFVIPWRGKSLIGTTDVDYSGDPDEYHVTKKSILGLIEEVNASFGDGTLSYDDVIFFYGGLRPLVEEDTSGTYESSRKYEIYDNADDDLEGLITVEGGKYTTSRNLAGSVLKLIRKKLGGRGPHASTSASYLAGCEIPDMKKFLTALKAAYPEILEKSVNLLGAQYGTAAETILSIARADKSLADVISQEGHLSAEIVYTVRYEMARTLEDVIFRRTGLGTAGNPGDTAITTAAGLVAQELGWGNDHLENEINRIRAAFQRPE